MWFVASQGNLRHWLEDPDCRDQYSVIYDSGEKTGIFSNDVKEPIEVEERAVRNVLFLPLPLFKNVLYIKNIHVCLFLALDRNIRALVS